LLEELDDITEVVLVYKGPRIVKKIARMSPGKVPDLEHLELAQYHDDS
jgi:hypothetical protein